MHAHTPAHRLMCMAWAWHVRMACTQVNPWEIERPLDPYPYTRHASTCVVPEGKIGSYGHRSLMAPRFCKVAIRRPAPPRCERHYHHLKSHPSYAKPRLSTWHSFFRLPRIKENLYKTTTFDIGASNFDFPFEARTATLPMQNPDFRHPPTVWGL